MKQHLAGDESLLVRASLLLSLGLLLPANEETALFFTRFLHEAEDSLIRIVAAMGYAFAMKKQTSQQALMVLLQSYEQPAIVKEQFSNLPFADVDLDASTSISLRWIGLSIASLVVPTLIRAVRHSNAWSGLTLVPNLLSFALEDQKIIRTMTVSHLTDLQRDALSAIYETEAVWGFGNMSFVVGNFFDSKFPNSTSSIFDRNDLGTFLSGQNVFRNEAFPCP